MRETPEIPWGDPATWANVESFGANPDGQTDASASIQKAIDSGAETVFFPGSYALQSPIILRGKTRRLLGVGTTIDYFHRSKPDLIIADGTSPLVVIEHFAPINGGIEIKTNRTVVFRDVEISGIRFEGKGDVFFEDAGTNDLKIQPGQNVWARQLNVENEGTHVTNPGGKLWILGYKTERGGTLLHTSKGGSSELFGNFSYTTTAGKLAPMFVTENASVFAFFNEICFSGDPFQTIIRETLDKVTKSVERGKGESAPYVSGDSRPKAGP